MEKITLLDGAMGTMLLNMTQKTKGFPETVNLTAPELVTEIHREYVEAGSGIIYTNTLGANAKKAEKEGFLVGEVVAAAIKNARAACNRDTCVALDIGSLGEMPEPYGSLSIDEIYEMFSEIISVGGEADLVVLETMFDLTETLTAVKAVKDNSSMPVFVTMTFTSSGRTITGCTPRHMAQALETAGVDAMGINCSLGPDESYPIMKEIRQFTQLPLIVKPNAGMPDPKTGSYLVGPEEFAEKMLPFIDLGVRYMGGCCGTNPSYISALRSSVAESR